MDPGQFNLSQQFCQAINTLQAKTFWSKKYGGKSFWQKNSWGRKFFVKIKLHKILGKKNFKLENNLHKKIVF